MAQTPQDYVQDLLNLAVNFSANPFMYENEVKYLYRCMSVAVYNSICNEQDGVMQPILKDNGGDPRCPINRKLLGLFFGVTLWNNDLPTRSPFGDRMVLVPLTELFNGNMNLYFADFYCMQGYPTNHYVCLVLTQQGSAEDVFCSQNLVQLSPEQNIFLRRIQTPNGIRYSTIKKDGLYLEIFYTNSVDIKERQHRDVGLIGYGTSQGGIPKSPYCRICNIPMH